MEEINGIPLVFDAKQDDAFLGNLFPNGLSFPTLEPTEKTIWKEEWKLKSPEEIQKYYFPEAIVTQKNNIALCDTTGVFKNVKFRKTYKNVHVKRMKMAIVIVMKQRLICLKL